MATATRASAADAPVPAVVGDEFAPPPVDARFEVIDGEPVEKPPTGSREVDIANLLAEALTLFAVPRGIGRAFVEPLFRLLPTSKNRRSPDVAFVSAARWPIGRRVPAGNAWHIAPDLAVEVVSPTDTVSDLILKIAEYFEADVAVVWVVLPEAKQVYVYTSPVDVRILTPPAELAGDPILPGFRLPLARLFEDDPIPAVP